MKSKRLLIILGACLVLVGCGLAFYRNQRKSERLIFSGTVEQREIQLGSKVGGRVLEVWVAEGQRVKAGQPLVRFDIAELQAQQAQLEARLQQAQVNLRKLQNWTRPEELAQAIAATDAARARYEMLRRGYRPEEIAQARADLEAAQAEYQDATVTYERLAKLYQTEDVSKQDVDRAAFRRESLKARVETARQRLSMLEAGYRKEDIQAAKDEYQQRLAAQKLVEAGARKEDLAEARTQIAENQARIEQLKVQIAEGELKATADALVETVSVRPGDLVPPNAIVIRMLEPGQVWVRIFVPEPQLGLIRVRQPAAVRIDTFAHREFSGYVEQINAQGEFTPRNVQSRDERNHQVFGVKVHIDDPEGALKSGMAADVTLVTERG